MPFLPTFDLLCVLLCDYVPCASAHYSLLSVPLPALVSSTDAHMFSGHTKGWTVLTFHIQTCVCMFEIVFWHHFRQGLHTHVHLISGWDNPRRLRPSHASFTLKKHLLPPTHRHARAYLFSQSRTNTALHTSS